MEKLKTSNSREYNLEEQLPLTIYSKHEPLQVPYFIFGGKY